jgi:hypothetical protein
MARMAKINRRDFVLSSTAATAGVLLARETRAETPSAAPRIDALCFGTVSDTTVQNAIDGGLTAVVYDLESYPRQYDTAVRELANWQERFDDPKLLLGRSATAASAARAKSSCAR